MQVTRPQLQLTENQILPGWVPGDCIFQKLLMVVCITGASDIQDLKTGFSRSLFFFDFVASRRKPRLLNMPFKAPGRQNSTTPPQPFTFIPPLLQQTRWSVPTAAPDKTTSLPSLAVPSGNKLNSTLHGSLPFLNTFMFTLSKPDSSFKLDSPPSHLASPLMENPRQIPSA